MQHATRRIMQEAGLPTPKHYRIEAPEDVSPAAAHVGFPVSAYASYDVKTSHDYCVLVVCVCVCVLVGWLVVDMKANLCLA